MFIIMTDVKFVLQKTLKFDNIQIIRSFVPLYISKEGL
jgi:hypothetical protein